MKKKVTKKHWYFTERTECVLCGHSVVSKIKRTDKKPKNPDKRYSYRQTACSEHFI